MQSNSITFFYILFLILLLVILSMQFPLYSSIFHLTLLFLFILFIIHKYYQIENEKRNSYLQSQQNEIDQEIFSILHLI